MAYKCEASITDEAEKNLLTFLITSRTTLGNISSSHIYKVLNEIHECVVRHFYKTSQRRKIKSTSQLSFS